jgi:hypothetical protein
LEENHHYLAEDEEEKEGRAEDDSELPSDYGDEINNDENISSSCSSSHVQHSSEQSKASMSKKDEQS